jgi:hypothetical protein
MPILLLFFPIKPPPIWSMPFVEETVLIESIPNQVKSFAPDWIDVGIWHVSLASRNRKQDAVKYALLGDNRFVAS